MAPPNNSRSSSSKRTRRAHQYKKKRLVIKPKSKTIQKTKSSVLEDLPLPLPSSNSSTKSSDNVSMIDNGGFDFEGSVDHDENNMVLSAAAAASSSPCSTPKAQRFRIPKMETCPPAPKKQRPVLSNCSLQRTPIAFFAPPDLELFFFFALRDISV